MNELLKENKQKDVSRIEARDYFPYVSGILWAVDKNMRYLDIEGQKLKEWNLAKAQVIGKTVQEFHQEGVDGTNTRNHRLALSKGRVTYQVEFGGINYDCKLHYLADREIIVGVATDITKEVGLEKKISVQEDSLLELSAPVIPVLDHVVIVPVTGQLTLQRTLHMQRHILVQVHELANIRTVILDFSGVEEVVFGSDSALQEIYQSLKLLGIETVLTGMTPNLSKNLVQNGTILAVDRIYATLKTAVKALAQDN